eukprot:scaffold388514_cov23-Prasinocladus_malaysianus.AAC.1
MDMEANDMYVVFGLPRRHVCISINFCDGFAARTHIITDHSHQRLCLLYCSVLKIAGKSGTDFAPSGPCAAHHPSRAKGANNCIDCRDRTQSAEMRRLASVALANFNLAVQLNCSP